AGKRVLYRRDRAVCLARRYGFEHLLEGTAGNGLNSRTDEVSGSVFAECPSLALKRCGYPAVARLDFRVGRVFDAKILVCHLDLQKARGPLPSSEGAGLRNFRVVIEDLHARPSRS